jgi:toxin ParE1/3/4
VKLEWSESAKRDLTEIRRYSAIRWGREVAKQYLKDLRAAAKFLAADPRRARPLRPPWGCTIARSHVLICFENTEEDTLVIARVLHGAMDIERHLPRAPKDLA